MSSGEQTPPQCHQHHGNSHDRIFGGFGLAEGAAMSVGPTHHSSSKRQQVPVGAASSGRRRRWVRTRTQHLSTLSLQPDAAGDMDACAGDHAATESASYGAATPLMPVMPDGEAAPPAPAADPPCGRYAYRRPDGNPVTGEGYSRLGSFDLQVSTKK